MFEITEEPDGFFLVGHADAEDSLEGAIEKWEAIVAFHEEYPDAFLSGTGGSTRSLCRKYHDGNCTGCPVFEYTGEAQCLGTPYYHYGENDDLGAARAELQFLRMLQWKAIAESLPDGEERSAAWDEFLYLEELVQRSKHDN